jgi:hypothetical protein
MCDERDLRPRQKIIRIGLAAFISSLWHFHTVMQRSIDVPLWIRDDHEHGGPTAGVSPLEYNTARLIHPLSLLLRPLARRRHVLNWLFGVDSGAAARSVRLMYGETSERANEHTEGHHLPSSAGFIGTGSALLASTLAHVCTCQIDFFFLSFLRVSEPRRARGLQARRGTSSRPAFPTGSRGRLNVQRSCAPGPRSNVL